MVLAQNVKFNNYLSLADSFLIFEQSNRLGSATRAGQSCTATNTVCWQNQRLRQVQEEEEAISASICGRILSYLLVEGILI